MKTEKRKLQPQWVVANEKTGEERSSLSQREVSVLGFASVEELVSFAGRSVAHRDALVELVNNQLHIKFGSATAKAALLTELGVAKASAENQSDAESAWKKMVTPLDYVRAFGEAVEKPRRTGKTELVQFDRVRELLVTDKLPPAAAERLGINTVEELEARYKAPAPAEAVDLDDVLGE